MLSFWEPLLFPVKGEGLTHPHLSDPGTALFPLPQQLSPPPVGSAHSPWPVGPPAPGHVTRGPVTAIRLSLLLQPVTLFSKALRFFSVAPELPKGLKGGGQPPRPVGQGMIWSPKVLQGSVMKNF